MPPRIIDDSDWKWLKNYRVWEANRKVFLYPENWIEPELRDDKSPLFQALERTILQQEIKNDNVEAAFADYLEGLDEIARLDVRGVWFEERADAPHGRAARCRSALHIPPAPRSEWDHGTYHVFARTFNAPHVWYYRRLENGRTWTPWEKIDADIEGEHLVPVVFKRRMHLFWTMFREVSKPLPPAGPEEQGAAADAGQGLGDPARLLGLRPRPLVAEADVGGRRGRRSARSRHRPARSTSRQHELEGSRMLSPSDYTLRATVTDTGDLPQLHAPPVSPRPSSGVRPEQRVPLAPRRCELVAASR